LKQKSELTSLVPVEIANMSLSTVRRLRNSETGAVPSTDLEGTSPLVFHYEQGGRVIDEQGRRVIDYERSKRAIDVCVSLSLLILLSPLLLAIALLVKATSRGPVIFRHGRVGRYGRRFGCLKFRTMVENAEEVLRRRPDLREEFEANFKLKNDPRLTRIGGFLRKSSLDELPQLINVLRGELSLIGPRPIVPSELTKYGSKHRKLLSVKPGLGGFWQVYGRSDTTYEERIAMDMEYIDRRSLGLDLKLMALTARVVIEGRGAY
jgi:lipopolysaccharide/colanic/teichoic acid biosynthesis glycosyltransferase